LGRDIVKTIVYLGFQNESALLPLFHAAMLTRVRLGLGILSVMAMLRQLSDAKNGWFAILLTIREPEMEVRCDSRWS